MLNEGSRYNTDIFYVYGDAGAEKMVVGAPLLVAPSSKARTGVPRSAREIKAAISPKFVSSVQEICRIGDLRIRGQWKDVDGTVRATNIAAIDERSYTPDQLVSADPGLRARYLELRLSDALAETVEASDVDVLSDEDEQALEALCAELERSVPAEEDAR